MCTEFTILILYSSTNTKSISGVLKEREIHSIFLMPLS